MLAMSMQQKKVASLVVGCCCWWLILQCSCWNFNIQLTVLQYLLCISSIIDNCHLGYLALYVLLYYLKKKEQTKKATIFVVVIICYCSKLYQYLYLCLRLGFYRIFSRVHLIRTIFLAKCIASDAA